jgi:hypothetical protein
VSFNTTAYLRLSEVEKCVAEEEEEEEEQSWAFWRRQKARMSAGLGANEVGWKRDEEDHGRGIAAAEEQPRQSEERHEEKQRQEEWRLCVDVHVEARGVDAKKKQAEARSAEERRQEEEATAANAKRKEEETRAEEAEEKKEETRAAEADSLDKGGNTLGDVGVKSAGRVWRVREFVSLGAAGCPRTVQGGRARKSEGGAAKQEGADGVGVLAAAVLAMQACRCVSESDEAAASHFKPPQGKTPHHTDKHTHTYRERERVRERV